MSENVTPVSLSLPVHRCSNHRGRPDLPKLCHTCQRINVEWDIVTRTVDALSAAGYLLQTDMQEDPRPEKPTGDRETILREMMDVDDEFLGVFRFDADTAVTVTTPVGTTYAASARDAASWEDAGSGRDLLPEMLDALAKEGEFWFTPATVAKLADKRPDGWVRFVYGNSGWDCISDYTMNLESILAPVNAYAESLDAEA